MNKVLDISENLNVSYCISNELRDEQIKININKVKNRIAPEDLKTEPIAIVCFGPSLNETWEELKKFKNIMTCSGAHKFLIDKGIIPTYHVELEPREHKVKMLGKPHKDTQYLIASTIHPVYLEALKDYNVKLWHIFANQNEGEQVLPRGEWMITGGSSVGLRCMTLSRFLGYTDLHIFGMDGSFVKSGTHTTFHPNAPKEQFETDYKGIKYYTTPSVLFCAKETFKELDQMSDVKATFYGEGLVQAMAKDYVPATKPGSIIAFNRPELISNEYVNLNKKLHQDNPRYGMGGSKHADTILKLSKQLNTTSILDYGAGKMMLAKSLPFPIWNYDPCVPEISASPNPADIVCCTDVLEHIEPEKLPFVLDDLRRVTKQIGYFVISTRPAVKTYANGQNTHLIVQGKDWWQKQLSKHFEIGTIIEKEKEKELHVVVGPKKIPQPDMQTVEQNGIKVKFLTPNETTKWRAKTLLTKEPITIEWINNMKPGEVFFDVGANVGGYSVWAGAKGLNVYSFEPEAENYLLLVKNMILNNIKPQAYQIAITDVKTIGMLYKSNNELGGSQHTFNEKQSGFPQGCIGLTLDSLIENGNIPSPDYLKIDVDGLEYNVIKGATNTLKTIKSLLVEIDINLPAHQELISTLESLGFKYDETQVESSKRKDGPFKGVAEYVFFKTATKVIYENINTHIIDRINNTKLQNKPYPYLYVENVFPENVYNNIINNFPNNYIEIEKSRGTQGYPKRFTSTPNSPFWSEIYSQLLSGKLKETLSKKFNKINYEEFTEDLLLIRDNPGYAIPPHTDSLSKVITALFYLPKDNSYETEGTSIFKPKKKGFICDKGIHYNFEDFSKVTTLPFRPNSLLVFARTDNSFHGVEPCNHVRDVLLYNIKKNK